MSHQSPRKRLAKGRRRTDLGTAVATPAGLRPPWARQAVFAMMATICNSQTGSADEQQPAQEVRPGSDQESHNLVGGMISLPTPEVRGAITAGKAETYKAWWCETDGGLNGRGGAARCRTCEARSRSA